MPVREIVCLQTKYTSSYTDGHRFMRLAQNVLYTCPLESEISVVLHRRLKGRKYYKILNKMDMIRLERKERKKTGDPDGFWNLPPTSKYIFLAYKLELSFAGMRSILTIHGSVIETIKESN